MENILPLTPEQAAIITAYTGILICKFNIFHGYAEKKLGRPIFTHEFGNAELLEKLKEASKEEFIALNPKCPWINVKDQLPPEDKDVLIFWDEFITTGYLTSTCEDDINRPYWIASELACDLPVTHWMPLPEAPK